MCIPLQILPSKHLTPPLRRRTVRCRSVYYTNGEYSTFSGVGSIRKRRHYNHYRIQISEIGEIYSFVEYSSPLSDIPLRQRTLRCRRDQYRHRIFYTSSISNIQNRRNFALFELMYPITITD